MPHIAGVSPDVVEALTPAAHPTFAESVTSVMSLSWILAGVGIIFALLVKRPAADHPDESIVVGE